MALVSVVYIMYIDLKVETTHANGSFTDDLVRGCMCVAVLGESCLSAGPNLQCT